MPKSFKINGWAKVAAVVVALGTHALYTANESGQDHQAIKGLQAGQITMMRDIRDLRKELREDIKGGMADRFTGGDGLKHEKRMDRIEKKLDDHVREGR